MPACVPLELYLQNVIEASRGQGKENSFPVKGTVEPKGRRPSMKRSLPIILVLTATLSFARGRAAVVTTLDDSGPGSLREAITNAIAGETITFAISGAITLSSGELLIAKDLTIAGPGATQLTVQRGSTAGIPDFRIFNIKGGTVGISGLTVNNGRAASRGGILKQAGPKHPLDD